jgi:hypothetical protein
MLVARMNFPTLAILGSPLILQTIHLVIGKQFLQTLLGIHSLNPHRGDLGEHNLKFPVRRAMAEIRKCE